MNRKAHKAQGLRNSQKTASGILIRRSIKFFLPIVGISILLCTRIKAQDNFQPSTMIGIHGGMNLSIMSFDPSIAQVGYQGNMAGIFLRYVSEPHLGFQIELNRTLTGFKEDLVGEETLAINPSKTNLVYTHEIECYSLPILTYVELGKRNTRFSFYIGPQISYVQNQKTSMLAPVDTAYQTPYHFLETDHNILYSLLGGTGIMQKTSIGVFQLNLRFERSLSDLLDPDISGFINSENNTFSVYVGYSIYLKGGKRK